MAKRAIKPPFRVGLLGETPNDTTAMQALLVRRYGDRVTFFTLVRGVTGDSLKDALERKLIRREYQCERPDLVLFIRDLDALETDRAQYRARQREFREINALLDGKAIYLLHIYTIEALIAAHIAVFEDHYQCQCPINGDVMLIEKPVELFKAVTKTCKKQYKEGHCADLLAQADYDQLLANCRYFRDFDAAFAARVPPPIVLPSKAESDARNGIQ